MNRQTQKLEANEAAQFKAMLVEGKKPYLVVEVPSSKGTSTYRVDATNGRCSCPSWKFAKAVDGVRPACKHLKMLGLGNLH